MCIDIYAILLYKLLSHKIRRKKGAALLFFYLRCRCILFCHQNQKKKRENKSEKIRMRMKMKNSYIKLFILLLTKLI